MTEEITKNLTADEKLDLILSRLDGIETRLAKVEVFVEDRSRDTRPMLDRIHKDLADTRVELAEMRADVGDVKREIRLLREDMWNERKERVELAERVGRLDARPAA